MADTNKAEKLAAARRKLKEYQKKNKDIGPSNYTISQNTPPVTGATERHQQSYVFDSGTEDSSPTEVPPVTPAVASNGCESPKIEEPQQAVFSGVFSSDARDFFDNLPLQPQSDDVVASEMPECDIRNQNLHIEESLISSSTESLRQLSLQMNGLIDESVEPSQSSVSELERRNQELAAMLADKEQKMEHLQLQAKEYQSRLSQLQVDLGQLQAESEMKLARELNPVQEQLQLHIQTVGILVGEKTELQAALGKSHQVAKQKAAEVEELQGRLKASRHRVTELENELSSAASVKEQIESGAKEGNRLRSENGLLKKQLEEAHEDVSELKEKLNAQSVECSSLQQEVQEKHSQIDLLQLKLQQLNTCDRPDADQLLEAMHQQKVALEWQVSELQQTVKSLSVDREQATQQYQDYLQQFNAQLKNMADKLAATAAENEQLVSREQSLVHHVSELEKQLQQQLQCSKEDSKGTDQMLEAVHAEKQELSNQLEVQLQEKASVMKELEQSTKRVEELEAMVEALQADQPDKNLLLAAMESDKVAAAQAVAQNQKLKVQLEELQDSFVKMSNEKLELTEHLQREQHVSRELEGRLNELQENLRFQLGAKEKECMERSKVQMEDLMSQNSELQARLADREMEGTGENNNSYISMKEAMEKLEARFTKTMQEVAELTEEKQRLEHIVIQLQGETETIGEYIALYQLQRGMLRERAREKDEQLTRLRRDREEMAAKLNELTNLVQRLLDNKQPPDPVDENVEKPEEHKIMALLSDISSSTLVEPLSKGSESFHPCPWCSGQLITV